jgi:hypothetical protein
VHVDGRNLNVRLRVNPLVNGRRNLADLAIQPNNILFRTAISKGESLYDAFIVGVNRRMSHRLDLSASYTMSRSTSDIGSASDETDVNLVQDISNPFGSVQDAPSTRSDARHRVALTAIVEGPVGINIAPIFLYRSALPTATSSTRQRPPISTPVSTPTGQRRSRKRGRATPSTAADARRTLN